ncbi:4-hydroxythreonine-4-phosphate dehydrogenase [Cognatiyoonia sediminum]|uniref:4-hydroxythreonine-4-phosphate dehydrogenase n=1 Tax=Cognatiyoonia sediminum TaxID=1508389 RepID=A0A1M5LXG2_9RHOB|nr:4-hydroxythreonine-4-phosphate dehydrogenase PdxA [Cognatiyoonia sediminum]SHG69695.1 4-hydroxythreonine-4-phosphate dehydrogenase [Cognatiyoonia sediminum]
MADPKPVAISCGEPAGIGIEITVDAWKSLKDDVPLLWLGDPNHLPKGTAFEVVPDPSEAREVCSRALPVWAMDFQTPRVAGTPDPTHAKGTISSIETAVGFVTGGKCAALCTAPIHKAALKEGADFAFPGHTEFLAHLAGRGDAVMMLACDELRVVPATIHIPLADVPEQLTARLLTDTILVTNAALKRDFGIDAPRMAVAGLNPHAGENGKMGSEEIEMISPVLDALRNEGLDISGPLSADTMFHAAARKTYDVAICMYHDQALIPIKTIDFSGGVNVTLGLPFVRTSPDHGTAFDIAGKGIADPTSMIAAIRMAAQMAEARS